MKKILFPLCPWHTGRSGKMILFMKLTALLLLGTFLQASANVYSQKKFFLNYKEINVEKLFNVIERKSNYRFLYNDNSLPKELKLTVKVSGATLPEILDTYLVPYLRYKILENNIVVLGDPNTEIKDMRVTGTIRNEAGEALVGVSIKIKGTNRGTLTDAAGNFTLVAPADAVLVVSYIGYQTVEIPVNNKSEIRIILKEDKRNLSEVVVTALGIQRQARTLTYAMQQIKGEQLNEIRDANFINTLSGKVAGAFITQSASGPGGATRIVLRGNRSIQGSNNALIVVDGVAIDNQTPAGNIGNDFGGYNSSDGAANINPDDIESVNVLKGAAAAALYGSRAANGVILITTKKGKAGKMSAEINSGVVLEKPMILPKFQNEYGQGAGGTSSNTASGSWGGKTTTYPDNVKSFFRNAVSYNHSVSVNAGTEKTQAYFSYSNNYNQGLVPRNDLTRNTLNLRIGTNITSKLSTDVKITYVNQSIIGKVKSGEEGSHVIDLYKVPRSISADQLKSYETLDAFGRPSPKYWTTSSIYMNPYWFVNRTSVDEERNRVTLLGSVKYQLTDWLSLQGRYSLDRYNDKATRLYYDKTLLFARQGGSYSVGYYDILERNMDVLLSGNNKISKDFNITYNIGASVLVRKTDITNTNADGLQIPNKFDLSFARSLSVGTAYLKRELQSVYGTAQLAFRDYLFLDITGRNDWSSTLPAPYAYFYPSVGLSAVVSDMVRLPVFINFTKLRASYTQVGNDAAPYLLTQTYSFSQGGTGGFISRSGTKPIENLKPELTTSLEFGLNMRFLKDRLGFDLTLYKTNSINQLLFLGLPPATGYSNQYINAGNIENKGIELVLNGTPVKQKEFTWEVTLNYARNVNKIVALSPDVKQAFLGGGYGRTAGPVVKEGGAYGDLYAFRWARNDNGQLIVDANGRPVSSKEQQLVGNYNPRYTLGLNNSFSFGRFVAGLLVDGRVGGVMTSGTEANLAFDGNADYTIAYRSGGWILPAITQAGGKNTTAINAETFWTTVSGGRYSWGEFFTYNTTNFRVREFSLGYRFSFRPTAFVKNAKLSFIARNLFFLYRGDAILDIPGIGKRKMNFDPDINLGAGNYQGIEYGNLPSSRSIGLNLKLNF